MIKGFFLFLIFICKPSVWIMTKKQHPKLVKVLTWPINMFLKRFNRSIDVGIPLQNVSSRVTKTTIEIPQQAFV